MRTVKLTLLYGSLEILMADLGRRFARRSAAHTPLGFAGMTLMFAVLTYFGMIIYIHADQITTVRAA